MNKLAASAFAIVVFLLLGVVVAAMPMQQSAPDGAHSHPHYETQIADLQTFDAMVWGTVDSLSLATEIATLIGTAPPVPTNTARPSSTPTTAPPATGEYPFPTPTAEDWSDIPTGTPDDASDSRTALILAGAGVNVRLCPDTSCLRENVLPYNSTTHIWYSTCGYYVYSKVLDDYIPASDGTIRWCQLNVGANQRYWIAVQSGNTVLAEIQP